VGTALSCVSRRYVKLTGPQKKGGISPTKNPPSADLLFNKILKIWSYFVILLFNGSLEVDWLLFRPKVHGQKARDQKVHQQSNQSQAKNVSRHFLIANCCKDVTLINFYEKF